MNIFAVDRNPIQAAKDLCDKHVVKMPLESAQLAMSPWYGNYVLEPDKGWLQDNRETWFAVFDGFPKDRPYLPTHHNHPCAKWTRSTLSNYEWLLEHGIALCEEYTRRYDKEHGCAGVLLWCYENIGRVPFPGKEFEDPPLAMPSDSKTGNFVESYRTYYAKHKQDIAEWNHTSIPVWYRERTGIISA